MDAIITYEEGLALGSIFESIETNLWLADGYAQRGATGLAESCRQSARDEFIRFGDQLRQVLNEQEFAALKNKIG